jgi:predicted adenylyl cyclase CyaB
MSQTGISPGMLPVSSAVTLQGRLKRQGRFMDFRLNREIKAYCRDFEPVRVILRKRSADLVAVKEQVDYYYRLPPEDYDAGTRRLKLRVEPAASELIYYVEGQEDGARTSRFRIAAVDDSAMGGVLEAALGTRAVVRKRRELWRKDNVVFNLDTVEGVGQILEVEVQDEAGCDIDAQVDEYRSLLGRHLNGYITGSNEDLVAAITGPT